MKKNRSLQRRQKGQSLVELAIAVTVLMWLLAGMIDLGMGLFTWISLREAAEEGALYGSAFPTEDIDHDNVYDSATEPFRETAIRQYVCASTTNPVKLTGSDNINCDATRVTVNITHSTPSCAGGWIRVDILYNYRILMPLTSTIIGSQTIPIRASATNTLLRYGCP